MQGTSMYGTRDVAGEAGRRGLHGFAEDLRGRFAQRMGSRFAASVKNRQVVPRLRESEQERSPRSRQTRSAKGDVRQGTTPQVRLYWTKVSDDLCAMVAQARTISA
jgi:hypothetical protein